jgi:hypothetical protein
MGFASKYSEVQDLLMKMIYFFLIDESKPFPESMLRGKKDASSTVEKAKSRVSMSIPILDPEVTLGIPLKKDTVTNLSNIEDDE